MKIIFFAPGDERGNQHMHNLIDSFTVLSGLEIYRSINTLKQRLFKPHGTPTVVVLFVTGPETLREIIDIRELLGEVKVILVLPDNRPETVAQGHLLRPRFIAYADTAASEINAVLQKMAGEQVFPQGQGDVAGNNR